MSNSAHDPVTRSESVDARPARKPGYFDAIFARLPVFYFLLGLLLVVFALTGIGPVAPRLAVAGGLCFVASAIAYRQT